MSQSQINAVAELELLRTIAGSLEAVGKHESARAVRVAVNELTQLRDTRSVKFPGCRLRHVFGAWTTEDELGRRGKLIGYFTTRGTAEEAADKRGWFGGSGIVQDALALEMGEIDLIDKVVIVSDGPLQLNVDLISQRDSRLAVARAKLAATFTPEEIELLGISVNS